MNTDISGKRSYHFGNSKEALIGQGITLIHGEGIEKFSLRKVAKKVGVPMTVCYNHFGNTDDLLREIYPHVIDRFAAALRQAVKDNSCHHVTISMGVVYVEFFAEYPHYFNFLSDSEYLGIRIKETEITWNSSFTSFEVFITGMKRGMRELNIDEEELRDDFLVVWATVHGLVAMANTKGVQYDSDDWGALTERLLLSKAMLRYTLKEEEHTMTETEAIRVRHAVRNYTAKPLSPEIIDELRQEIEQCNRQGQLHIQLATENEEAFKTFIPLFGWFKNVKNYIALAAKKQGDFYMKCGYCGTRLMVKAQQVGLNSCWVTNTYDAKKCPVTLAPDEELVGVTAVGYGTTDGMQHKSRSMERLCKPCSDKWFLDGINAAVLALTSPNRQDFFIEANGSTVSICIKDSHPMSQINTGIVRYYSEIGAGRENLNWE